MGHIAHTSARNGEHERSVADSQTGGGSGGGSSSSAVPAALDMHAVTKLLTLDVIGRAAFEQDWGFLTGEAAGGPLAEVPHLISDVSTLHV